MTKSRTKYQFYQEASLSQKLADHDPDYTKLAGSDKTISDAIGFLLVLNEHNFIDLGDATMSLVFDLLNIQRKSAFATSPHTNEISKMGMQMPKSEDEISEYNEED